MEETSSPRPKPERGEPLRTIQAQDAFIPTDVVDGALKGSAFGAKGRQQALLSHLRRFACDTVIHPDQPLCAWLKRLAPVVSSSGLSSRRTWQSGASGQGRSRWAFRTLPAGRLPMRSADK